MYVNDNRGMLPVFHLDGVDGILGPIAVAGHCDGNRFTDIAHALDRDRTRLDRRTHA